MMLDRFKVPAKDQVLVSETDLRRTVTQIFEKLGVSAEDAADAADALTMTDLRGVETHGVSNMLPHRLGADDDAEPSLGVGVVTVYNSGHFGAIGHFAMQAAQ